MGTNIKHTGKRSTVQTEKPSDKTMDFPNKPAVKINVSLPVLHFIATHPTMRKKHKFTKAEAYYDLCHRQYMTAVTADTQFMTGGIQELANSWSWARDSVSRFIAHLVQCQVAKTINISTSVVVILTNIEGLPDLPDIFRQENNNRTSSQGILGNSDRPDVQKLPPLASYTSEVPEASHDPTRA